MEFQPNQENEKGVKPAVEVVTSNVLEPEIDSQILTAFMELDPIFNPADVDVEVEEEKMAVKVPSNLLAAYKEKVSDDDDSPISFSRSTKKSMSSLSKCQKFTVIDESADEEFKNNNIIDDDTNEQDDVAVENNMDGEDDLDDFIDDKDADDDDTDDDNTGDDF
nr:hypothetical protein [Tanacetum cinerariifolium]